MSGAGPGMIAAQRLQHAGFALGKDTYSMPCCAAQPRQPVARLACSVQTARQPRAARSPRTLGGDQDVCIAFDELENGLQQPEEDARQPHHQPHRLALLLQPQFAAGSRRVCVGMAAAHQHGPADQSCQGPKPRPGTRSPQMAYAPPARCTCSCLKRAARNSNASRTNWQTAMMKEPKAMEPRW